MLFNPVVGGKKLPSLTNPAAAADIMQNKQAIDQSGQIITGTKAPLPTLTNPGSAGDLLSGKQLLNQGGNVVTGTITTRSSSSLTASGSSIIVPAGYYPSQVSKSVATVTQATPSISVSSNGLITASATQSAGYVSSGTKSATRQLTTQAGKTITPSTYTQTAVSSGRYTTGAITVSGSANLIADNIRDGVNIFGVIGSLVSGGQFYVETDSFIDESPRWRIDCGFEPIGFLLSTTNFRSFRSESAEDFQEVFVFAHTDLGWYLDGYLDVVDQEVQVDEHSRSSFRDLFDITYSSTGLTFEFGVDNSRSVLEGPYMFFVFA